MVPIPGLQIASIILRTSHLDTFFICRFSYRKLVVVQCLVALPAPSLLTFFPRTSLVAKIPAE
jgi:hypothetical protein